MPHTPGPWFVADWADDFGSNFVTIEARSKEVREPGQTSLWPGGIVKHRVASTEDGDNPIDDARLIAAAPDMLKVIEWFVSEHENVDGADIPTHIYKEAKAALAKARGETV